MGNCFSLSETSELHCSLCDEFLARKYLVCTYCKDRYHYQCLYKFIPELNRCYHCNQKALQCVELGRNSTLEDSYESTRTSIRIRNDM